MINRNMSYAEKDDIYAKNDAIISALEKNLWTISSGLTEIIARCSTASGYEGPKAIYQLMRAVLDSAMRSTPYIIPMDAQSLKQMMDDYSNCVYVIDDIIDRKLADVADRKELGYGVRQYLKDYLYGICTILENDPKAEDKEFLEDVEIMSNGLRDILLLRCGYIQENFEDDRLL